ncbi:hypothetical protein ACQKH5_01685 [Hyphomonas sp. NPDC076900]|uniref:hypothetical protein n=1 Tax=unclassified Hyphomonas TaxID=2630699 RepID=UPI003CFDC27F
MSVYETRRQTKAVSLYHLITLAWSKLTDSFDPAGAYSHVTRKSRLARTIDDPDIRDQDGGLTARCFGKLDASGRKQTSNKAYEAGHLPPVPQAQAPR